MVSCKVVTDGRRTLIIGAYHPPSTLEHLLDLEQALKLFQDQYSIVIGDLSVDIRKTHNTRSQQFSDLVMKFVMMELLLHFWKCWRYWHMTTWTHVR